MTQKKIAQNQGDSGRVNLSGSELEQFGGTIGDSIVVDVAETTAIAKAMLDSKDSSSYIIISESEQEADEGNNE
jgi:hypothetical protein